MRGGARGVLGWFLSTQISVITLIRADDVRCDELSHIYRDRELNVLLLICQLTIVDGMPAQPKSDEQLQQTI